MIGRIDDDELPAYYGACDVFCLSSIQKTEAFGIVQIEAMSCGKPVVATKIPQSGVSWVNADGVSGINVLPEDAHALADAIKTITADEATYKKYVAGANRRYNELFTKERMIENFNSFDFTLAEEEMQIIAGLDTGKSPIYDDMDLEVTKYIGLHKIHD